MIDHQEQTLFPTDAVAAPASVPTPVAAEMPPVSEPAQPAIVAAETEHGEGSNGVADERWQARAGREGARRVHQLIQAGRLYEQEHGLKRGRQRLRQLIELGKLYEQEHGLRPA